jgi:hypothetical protein
MSCLREEIGHDTVYTGETPIDLLLQDWGNTQSAITAVIMSENLHTWYIFKVLYMATKRGGNIWL